MTAVIRTEGLTKRYGSVTAVDGIELDVRAGDVYGFLGPNGSGKTTTVRMLLGLVLPTAGTVEVLGARIPRHARSVLPRVGALVEAPAAYGHLGARANLSLLDASGPGGSRRTRKARIDEALEQVGLAAVGRRPVKAYSLGMRQRLGLAGALLRRPELLILDEPTNGLDPRGIQEIRALLLDLNSTGTTVFLSSHLLAEVEQLCRRVGVVDRGRLVLQDTLASLRAPTGSVVLRTPDPEWAVGLLDGELRSRSGDRLVVRADDPAALNARLVGHGIRITELAEERRTLEDVVLAATTTSADRADAVDRDPGLADILEANPTRPTLVAPTPATPPSPVSAAGGATATAPVLPQRHGDPTGSTTDAVPADLSWRRPEPTGTAADPDAAQDPPRRRPDPAGAPDLPRRRPDPAAGTGSTVAGAEPGAGVSARAEEAQ